MKNSECAEMDSVIDLFAQSCVNVFFFICSRVCVCVLYHMYELIINNHNKIAFQPKADQLQMRVFGKSMIIHGMPMALYNPALISRMEFPVVMFARHPLVMQCARWSGSCSHAVT